MEKLCFLNLMQRESRSPAAFPRSQNKFFLFFLLTFYSVPLSRQKIPD